MRDVVILGGGDHGSVLAETMALVGLRSVAVADNKPLHRSLSDTMVAIDDNELMRRYPPGSILLANGLGGIGDTDPRKTLFERFRALGYGFVTVIHPSAVLARDVTLGEGAQVLAGAIIQGGTRIGENALINIGVVIAHDGIIGAHSHLAPGVSLSGGVNVGEASHLGTGACVIQHISIGARCVIGAGAAVIRNVPDGVTAVGVPARWHEQ